MTRRRKILIGTLVAVVLVAASVLAVRQGGGDAVEVRTEAVARRDLVAVVTASGNIRARRAVEVQSDVMGRIIELNVEEGDDVARNDVLLRLDPTQIRAAVARAEASLSQARAQAAQAHASYLQALRDYERTREIRMADSTLVSAREYDDAETRMEVQKALWEAASHGVEQADAALDEARDRLAKTTIRAPIAGKVTRLSVEEGETVIVGTMNNPGSQILTVSDLGVVEAVVEVDETDVPSIALGDSAVVEIDAFPDREFRGVVTKIGNSAIRPPESFSGSQTASIDFEVVITLEAPGAALRPDLSATAEIITDTREDVLSIPIIALTVREPGEEAAAGEDAEGADSARSWEAADSAAIENRDFVEGVFRVVDGEARFVPVEVGITGEEYFEVVTGLEEGDTVVSGPYQRIRELRSGSSVTSGDDPGSSTSTGSGS